MSKEIKDEGYQAPVVEELVPEPKPEPKPEANTPKLQVTTTKKEPTKVHLNPPKVKEVVTKEEKNILFNAFRAQLDEFFNVLGKRRSVKREKQQELQDNFIHLINNSLKLEYKDYKEITLYIIDLIKEHKDVFDAGTQFRFVHDLRKTHPEEYLDSYRTYMSFLYLIAKNWAQRHRLRELVDEAQVASKLGRRGKANTIKLFSELSRG